MFLTEKNKKNSFKNIYYEASCQWLMDGFMKFLTTKPVTIKNVLDIGAHKGKWSRDLKTYFPSAACHLFDPLPEMEPFLKKHCADFPSDQYFSVGLGSNNETRNITKFGDLEGSTFLGKDVPVGISKGTETLTITSINHLISENKIPVPDLVKIDVQGFELEVLGGADKIFGKTEIFIIECNLFEFDLHPGMPEFIKVIQFMHEKGYSLYDFAGFQRRPSDSALGQFDAVFVKSNGVLRTSKSW